MQCLPATPRHIGFALPLGQGGNVCVCVVIRADRPKVFLSLGGSSRQRSFVSFFPANGECERERGFWLDNNHTVFFGSQEYYSEYTSVFVVSALWLVGLLSQV